MKYFLTIAIGIILIGCNNDTVVAQEQANETMVENNNSTSPAVNTAELILDNGEGTINNQDTEKPQTIKKGDETTVDNNDRTDSTIDTGELILDNGEGTVNNQDTEKPQTAQKNTVRADITHISTTGTENNYTFSVSLKSTEIGCDQYANWWEILDADGILIYRRVLGHSHPNEQPFTRSGGSVDIQKNAKIYIRAHMNNKGYVGDIFEGSVKSGFSLSKNPISFSGDIELQEPLPSKCAF
jgi:Tfp pilus assembly protein PilX